MFTKTLSHKAAGYADAPAPILYFVWSQDIFSGECLDFMKVSVLTYFPPSLKISLKSRHSKYLGEPTMYNTKCSRVVKWAVSKSADLHTLAFALLLVLFQLHWSIPRLGICKKRHFNIKWVCAGWFDKMWYVEQLIIFWGLFPPQSNITAQHSWLKDIKRRTESLRPPFVHIKFWMSMNKGIVTSTVI